MNKPHIKIIISHQNTDYKKLKECLESVQNQTYIQKSIILLCNLKNYKKVFNFKIKYSTEIYSISTKKLTLKQLKNMLAFKYTDKNTMFIWIDSNFLLEKNCLKNLVISSGCGDKNVKATIIPSIKKNPLLYGVLFESIKDLRFYDYKEINNAIIYYRKDKSKWLKTFNSILTSMKWKRSTIQKKKLSI